ncbi:hypothetical protein C8J56DRAFT_1029088 [Mycena floridula]|nr:hypothetical protein C8J56DRAFT_1029088 [Mycena floridula]
MSDIYSDDLAETHLVGANQFFASPPIFPPTIMPFKLGRFWHRTNKASETSNDAGHSLLGEKSHADDGRRPMGNLIQSLQGARLGNINAPLFSNNQLTMVYNSQGSDNQDIAFNPGCVQLTHSVQLGGQILYAEIKVRDIILKKELKSDGTLHEAGPSFVTYVGDLVDQYISAADALCTQGLRPQRLSSKFNPNSVSKSLLEAYYDLVAMICEGYGFHKLTNFNASMMYQEGTTILRVPRPYILRLYNRCPEDYILCECMSDMSVRCTVPTADLIGLQFHQCLTPRVQSTASGLTPAPVFPIFNLWASQVHHIMKKMKINDMGVQTIIPQRVYIFCNALPRTPVWSPGEAHGLLKHTLLYLWVDCTLSSHTWWWSTDLEGQTVISGTEIEDAFNISWDIMIEMYEYLIPQQIYSIIWDIHKACGFNPDTTEMAQYLGYPLLEPVLESIHSDPYEEGSSKSDDYLSDGEMVAREHEEIGLDNESENGSTSSNDTFLSAASNV